MLFPYLNRPELAKKVGLFALFSSGISLAWTTSLNIAVLSVEVVERSTFPLLSSIAEVNLMEFLQRLDALVVLTLLILMFFKISILFYGAVIGVVDLFNLKNHQQIVLPAGIILIFLSMAIATNFSEHIEEGQHTAQYFIFPPIMVIIPLVMLLVSMIQNGFKKRQIEITYNIRIMLYSKAIGFKQIRVHMKSKEKNLKSFSFLLPPK